MGTPRGRNGQGFGCRPGAGDRPGIGAAPHKRCEVRGEGIATTKALDLTEERQPARRMGICEPAECLMNRLRSFGRRSR